MATGSCQKVLFALLKYFSLLCTLEAQGMLGSKQHDIITRRLCKLSYAFSTSSLLPPPPKEKPNNLKTYKNNVLRTLS